MTNADAINENNSDLADAVCSNESEPNRAKTGEKTEKEYMYQRGLVPFMRRHPILSSILALGLVRAGTSVAKAQIDYSNMPEIRIPRYLESQGITKENAKRLAPKLSLSFAADEKENPNFVSNEKKFVKIISAYPPELQRICIDSDILNKTFETYTHITDAELEAVRKAGLEGKVVNPAEFYGFFLFAPGHSENWLSQEKTREAFSGIADFYKLLREKGVSEKNIKFFYSNPISSSLEERINLEGIKVDGEATAKNFLDTLRGRGSDYNDTLYVVISAPNAKERVTLKGEWQTPETREFIETTEGNLSGENVLYAMSISERKKGLDGPETRWEFNYGRAVVILQTYGSKGMIGHLNTYADNIREGVTRNYMNKTTVIASPSDYTDFNSKFMKYFTSSVRRNSDAVVKELLAETNKYSPAGNGKAYAVSYGLEGSKTNEESPLYFEPLPFPKN